MRLAFNADAGARDDGLRDGVWCGDDDWSAVV